MKKHFLLLVILYSFFIGNSYARSNGLDGTVLMYLNGLGNNETQHQINIERLFEILQPKLGAIDTDIVLDGVHTGEVSGSLFLAQKASYAIYIDQLVRQGKPELIDPLVDELGNILFAKKITPPSQWKFSDEINLKLGELQLLFHTYDPFVQDMVKIITKMGNYITANKRIITLAHSQGSLFDNQAYTTLNNTAVFQNKIACQFGSFHQGSAVPSMFNPKGSYITVENDQLAVELEGKFLPHLEPNYQIENPTQDVIDSQFHSLLATYYNTSVSAIFLGLSNSEEIDGTMPDIAVFKMAKLADKMDESCNLPPVANFFYFVDPFNPLRIYFNGSPSTSPNGMITDYQWSFGGTGSFTSTTFPGSGNYPVSLIVTDETGAQSLPQVNIVTVAAEEPPPILFGELCNRTNQYVVFTNDSVDGNVFNLDPNQCHEIHPSTNFQYLMFDPSIGPIGNLNHATINANTNYEITGNESSGFQLTGTPMSAPL